VHGADLDASTPATGWDVRDAISHLRGTDREADKAATRPELFLSELPAIAQDIEAFLIGQLVEGRALGDRLLEEWQQSFNRLTETLAGIAPEARVPWYGPPMSAASFATARLMEYWAHGQDVADGLGATREPTARLRHIAHLGVRTRAFAYVNRSMAVPDTGVRVRLVAPDGSTWEWGSGPDEVSGPALDFCLLVTQRRHRDDLALHATAGTANEWLSLAQAFAGPPGPGRAACASGRERTGSTPGPDPTGSAHGTGRAASSSGA